ncbi:MAG TPA: VCBS repeat-containing protein [Planctomycetota bacterium]
MSIALLLTLGVLHGAPEYRRLRLHEVAVLADRVVVGRIEHLQDTTYDLLVEQTLVGTPQASLRIVQFGDWTCAGRYAPYAVGQRVLLFLKEERALGAGDEGEMPMVGEGALVPYAVRGSRLVERAVHGDFFEASWVPLADIASVLEDYRASFAFQPSERRGHVVGQTRARVSADELGSLQARSAFARELVEDTLRCPCMVGHEKAPSERAPDGALSARALELDPMLRMAQDDGLEFGSGFGRVLVAAPDPSDLVALAGASWAPCVVRLRGWTGPEGCSIARLGPDQLGITKPDLSWRAPDFGVAMALLDNRDPLLLAAGAPGAYHGRQDAPHTGSVHLVTWPAKGEPELRHSIRPDDAPAGLIDGCAFGRALCALGDLDGDGRSELVVGRQPDREWNGKQHVRPPGSLAVLFLDGASHVSRWTLLAPQDVGFEGPDEFGLVLAAPGDLDGDRIPDLVLGEPLDGAAGTYRGALRILFLTPAGAVREWRRIDATSAPGLALELGDELGAGLAAPGDLDGDGVPDLVASGSRALWSLLLRPDGTLKRARRQPLEGLLPTAVEPLALASAGADGHVLLAASFGVEKPRDVGLVRLRVDAAGAWTVARD